MSTNITIIRHAPTKYNKKGIFMGSLDIPPEPIDTNLVLEVRKQLDGTIFNAVYSSPYKRAHETAYAINNNKYDIIIDERLIERNLGDWEGNTKASIQTKYPAAFSHGIMDVYYCPPHGESYKHMIERISNFLSEIYQENSNVLIVTHNGVFRIMKSLITGDRLSNVFSQFESYLTPKSFTISKEIIEKIRLNPFYTVDI